MSTLVEVAPITPHLKIRRLDWYGWFGTREISVALAYRHAAQFGSAFGLNREGAQAFRLFMRQAALRAKREMMLEQSRAQKWRLQRR